MYSIELDNGEREDEGKFAMLDRSAMDGSQRSLVSSESPKFDRSAISKSEYDYEMGQLKDQITSRDEQMMQLRTSLEMKKNEVKNLQTRVADIEKNFNLEKERNDRHLKKIDDINLELKASETKLTAKLEENQMFDKQVRKLRQDLRNAEKKIDQLTLAKQKDVEVLHKKLSHARRGSGTPTSPVPSHISTPTPQDELIRQQMEIMDLKDQLIDREAEVDYHKRELELLKHKLETRSLEVDSNNQDLARRCQDLLEQNRKLEETVTQLVKSTTEHSQQLIRATEELKEANGKCLKLRGEINELESKMNDQMRHNTDLRRENVQLREENDDSKGRLASMKQELRDLQQQLDDLRDMMSRENNNFDHDRDSFLDRLTKSEKDNKQLREDLQIHLKDLQSTKNICRDLQLERDRLKEDLEANKKNVESRDEMIVKLRREIDNYQKNNFKRTAPSPASMENLRYENYHRNNNYKRSAPSPAPTEKLKLDDFESKFSELKCLLAQI